MAETRERWDSRGAFIMAAIGSAIGLGNVWRFPFIVGQNGGGAFFIPYFVALLTAGVPLMIVEYALGVKYQGSAAKSFRKIGKGWEWIGWWGLMVGTTISLAGIAMTNARRMTPLRPNTAPNGSKKPTTW